jgi:hypothetical protein
MSLSEKLNSINQRYIEKKHNIQTEEAAKNALILPFISALGYDVFSPDDVIPEFTADVGIKKNEKVDYALQHNNKVSILIECKSLDTDLRHAHKSQLYRYFTTTEAKVGILTNGTQYLFYSDIDKSNLMDDLPFFEFNIQNFNEYDLKTLESFSKSSFNSELIVNQADELKTKITVEKWLKRNWNEPSEEYLHFIISKVLNKIATQSRKELLKENIIKAHKSFLREQMNLTLDNAFGEIKSQGSDEVQNTAESNLDEDCQITTSDEEIEAFHIIKAIVRKEIDLNRVIMRDAKSYCAILIDDNNRKPLCRFYFNSKSVKYFSIFNGKEEDKKKIESIDQIYQLETEIIDCLKQYA